MYPSDRIIYVRVFNERIEYWFVRELAFGGGFQE